MRQKIYNLIENCKYYDYFMIICIICSIIPLCFKQQNQIFIWLDRITVTVFIIDYILRWLTADYKAATKTPLNFLKYPFGFFAIIDLISILPSIIPLNRGFKLVRILRLTKSFKVLRLLRYSKNFEKILNVIKRESRPLLAVCVLAFGYILISAILMFQIEPDSFDSFFDAIYWAVVTLTTVGYGDIYPSSDLGRTLSMLSSFIGIAIIALPTGIITAGYMEEINKTGETK